MKEELLKTVRERIGECSGEFGELLEKLLKDYEKQYSRMKKVIKQSDAQQRDLVNLNEELQRSYEKVNIIANSDRLTGVLNRYRCEQLLQELIDDQHNVSAMLIDIDNFHDITERLDLHIANNVIIQLSKLIKRIALPKSQLGRWSDHIFILFSEAYPTDDFVENGVELCDAADEHFFDDVEKVTVSIGIAATQPGSSLKNLVLSLEHALKRAIDGGKNQISV
jgi:diguanylate cyclase (GGDEF)-like protein